MRKITLTVAALVSALLITSCSTTQPQVGRIDLAQSRAGLGVAKGAVGQGGAAQQELEMLSGMVDSAAKLLDSADQAFWPPTANRQALVARSLLLEAEVALQLRQQREDLRNLRADSTAVAGAVNRLRNMLGVQEGPAAAVQLVPSENPWRTQWLRLKADADGALDAQDTAMQELTAQWDHLRVGLAEGEQALRGQRTVLDSLWRRGQSADRDSLQRERNMVKQMSDSLRWQLRAHQTQLTELLKNTQGMQKLGADLQARLFSLTDSLAICSDARDTLRSTQETAMANLAICQQQQVTWIARAQMFDQAFRDFFGFTLQSAAFGEDRYKLSVEDEDLLDNVFSVIGQNWQGSAVDVVFWGNPALALDSASGPAKVAALRMGYLEHRYGKTFPMNSCMRALPLDSAGAPTRKVGEYTLVWTQFGQPVLAGTAPCSNEEARLWDRALGKLK